MLVAVVLMSLYCATLALRADAALPRVRATITISGFQFRPADTTVTVGDTVVWLNRDAFRHTITADSGTWSSRELEPGGRYVFVATHPGRYAYHCAAHPVMRGILNVEAAPGRM